MNSPSPNHIVIVGAGAAGLMAARELAAADRRVTILEARDRCGGRIHPLPADAFGYAAEGGAEFVHGAAPVTRELAREAGLSLVPLEGSRWSARGGPLAPSEWAIPHMDRLQRALAKLETDLPIADFLATRFAGADYAELRRSITGMVEGYDAADPARASTLALRDEWMGEGLDQQDRVAGGYGALIAFLAAQCRRHGAVLRLGAAVAAIDAGPKGIVARCADGDTVAADAAIVTVPLPLWSGIALPPAVRDRVAAAAADIGFGNVVKIVLRFATAWWTDHGGHDLGDMSFLFGDAKVPTWWTQYPAAYPVLTGWYAGPKAETVAARSEDELVAMGLESLAQIFGLPRKHLARQVTAACAIDWGRDSLARGAYSYATPATRKAQAALRRPDGSAVFLAGEALYAGRDMGTVEAALANGRETARAVLAGEL